MRFGGIKCDVERMISGVSDLENVDKRWEQNSENMVDIQIHERK